MGTPSIQLCLPPRLSKPALGAKSSLLLEELMGGPQACGQFSHSRCLHLVIHMWNKERTSEV